MDEEVIVLSEDDGNEEGRGQRTAWKEVVVLGVDGEPNCSKTFGQGQFSFFVQIRVISLQAGMHWNSYC